MYRKSQAAVEMLIVIGIAFTMLIPSLLLFSQYSATGNQVVIASQVDRIGKEIISNVEAIYFYGKNSKTTIKVSFPDGLTGVYINKQNPPIHNISELVFNATLFGGQTQFVYFTKINISGNLTAGYQMEDAVSQGIKTFVIESHGDYVEITRILK